MSSNLPEKRKLDSSDVDNTTSLDGIEVAAEVEAKKAKMDQPSSPSPATTPLQTDNQVPNANDGPENDDSSDNESVAGEANGQGSGIRYQIALQNLVKSTKEKLLRKELIETRKLAITRIKKGKKWDFAYITFATKEDRDAALKTLEGLVIKDQTCTLESIDDDWVAGSNAGGGKTRRGAASGNMRKLKNKADPNDTRTPEERLADQVTPLWRLPYEEQLKEKTKVVHDVLVDVGKQLSGLASDASVSIAQKTLLNWVTEARDSNSGLVCPLLEIIPSPIQTNYRTKCEFSFGRDPDGNPSVGFLLGLIKDGFTAVMDASSSLHVSKAALRVLEAVKEYMKGHELQPYDRIQKHGNLRLVVVKTFWSGENQVVLQIHPQNLTRERIEQEKQQLTEFFRGKIERKEVEVTSLMSQEWDGAFNGFSDKEPLVSLIGDGYVHEDLCGLRFRVSPNAFFQINTPATEKLYNLVADWCGLSPAKDTTLLDLCCGTGTIGLTMAKLAKKIVGVEMSADAVKDAVANAEANGLKIGEDVEYICSKVEDALPQVFGKIHQGDKVVAVLDPPREGVHPSVVKAVRACADLKQVVFVSCNPVAASRNFVDLCRPTSEKFPGKPFKLVKAIPVDLFPQTKLVELVLFFDRSE